MTNTVLVTRPAHLSGELTQRLKEKGFEVICLPTIAIETIANQAKLESVFATKDPPDVGIFVSVNAVDAVSRWLSTNQLQWPRNTQCAAVGKKTAQAAIEQLGVNSVISPESDFGAKSLLQLDAMQDLKSKSVAVFQGENGSGLIQSEIDGKCRSLSTFSVYRMMLPEVDVTPISNHLNNAEIKFVIVTSVTGARNLFTLLGTQLSSRLNSTKFVVFSTRIAEFLHSVGCTNVLITDEASDESIISTIEQGTRFRVNNLANL